MTIDKFRSSYDKNDRFLLTGVWIDKKCVETKVLSAETLRKMFIQHSTDINDRDFDIVNNVKKNKKFKFRDKLFNVEFIAYYYNAMPVL